MRLIPAIDLIGGKCVRLTQGDFRQLTQYSADPLAVAQGFEGAGLTHLHVVDLDGARTRRLVNHAVLEKIASRTQLRVDFGGGLQSDEDVRIAFESGASQITGGSIAAQQPAQFLEWLAHYGAERVILGADVRHEKIAVSGWQEVTEQYVYDYVNEYQTKGIRYVISTDVARDGTLKGPSFDLYARLQRECPDIRLIASGGIGSEADLEQLAENGLFGAIIGKAFYEGKISLKALERLHLRLSTAE